MKVKALITATASALTMMAAGQASAAYVQPWTITGAETHTIRMGGATAQDKGLALLMRRLCAAGTMTQVSGNKQTAYFCDANGVDSLPIAAGTKIVMYKNSVSGSGSGVVPVSNAQAIPFLNLASLSQAQYQTPATCTYSTTAGTPDFADFQLYNCGTNIGTTSVAPDAGLSDVEPSLLGWVAGTSGSLTVSAGPQVLFGVPVSLNFYRALQTAQGKALDDTEANMPSLTMAQITAIWTGGIATPNLHLSDINGVKLANATGAAAFQLCRRKNGSGTLASARVFFTKEGCAASVKGMLSGADGDATAPAFPAGRIAEYGGTTGVLGCLNLSHSSGRYAIGMASMETKPGSAYTGDAFWGTDAGNWRYIKIEGYAPTTLNVAQTKYDFMMEATYQYRAAGNTFGPTLTASQTAFFDKIVSTNSSAAVIKELNTQFVHLFGQSGLMGKPSAGAPTAPSAAPAGVLTQAEVTANPVNTWTRQTGAAPNSCNPASIISKETGLNMLQ